MEIKISKRKKKPPIIPIAQREPLLVVWCTESVLCKFVCFFKNNKNGIPYMLFYSVLPHYTVTIFLSQ